MRCRPDRRAPEPHKRVAIYHLSIKPLSRAQGRSATAAAAYRSASTIHDETTGQTFDYRRKRGLEHAEVVLPSAAAARAATHPLADRERLWNAAEQAEKRKDARVAREYEVALPHELTKAERIELVRAFATELANRYGAVVDVAIHAPHREGDVRNHHAHVLTTTRVVEAEGLGAKTPVELSDADRRARGLATGRAEIAAIRARWAELTNEHLARSGQASRIDHRSLEAQGIAREPTIHQGPAITALERRGIRTEVGYRLEADASERLTRAAELGRLEREAREVAREFVTASTDLAAALRARDARASAEPTLTLAEQQARAREAWLASRADTPTLTREPAPSRDAAPTKHTAPGLILPDERRRDRDDDLSR